MLIAKTKKSFFTLMFLLVSVLLSSSAIQADITQPKSGMGKMIVQLEQLLQGTKDYDHIWETYLRPPINGEKNKYYWLLKKMWKAAPGNLPTLRLAFENKKLRKQTRVIAALLLAVNGDKKSIKPLLEALSDHEMTYGISYVLQIHPAPEVTTKLNELVFDKKSKIIAYSLIDVLAHRPETEALKGLEEAVKQQRFGGHELVETINGILSHGKKGVPILCRLYKTMKYERYLVAQALAASPYWEAQELVVNALKLDKAGKFVSTEGDDARHAFEGLSHVKAIEALGNIVKNAADDYSRSIAVRALGNINDDKAFHILLENLTDPIEYVAIDAAKALGRTGYKAGVGDLLRMGRALFRSLHRDVLNSLIASAFSLDRERVAAAVTFYRKSKDKEDLAYADTIEQRIGKDRLSGKIPAEFLSDITSGFLSQNSTKRWEAMQAAVRWKTAETGKLLLDFVKRTEPLLPNCRQEEWTKGLIYLKYHGYGPGQSYIKQSLAKMLPMYQMDFKGDYKYHYPGTL